MLGTSARLFGIRSVKVMRMYVSGRRFSGNSISRTRTKLRAKRAKDDEEAEEEDKTEWSDEQKRIISAVEEGKSVFISGAAGTGKTLLLNHIMKLLRKRYKPTEVFATATTGIAACSLRGQTLYSFAGIGYPMPMGLREGYLKSLNKMAVKRWLKVKALLIDEISMVDGELFEILERIARTVRGPDRRPWGGIQLVAGGDFFQLPPVYGREVSPDEKEFAFEAQCWGSSFALQVELERVYRQTDPEFVKLLHGVRRGEIGPEGIQILRRRTSVAPAQGVSAVELYPRNADVTRVNDEMLRRLKKESVLFRALDSGREPWVRELEKGISPGKIALCEGARVMLIKNLNTKRSLVNGSTGTVVGFRDVGPTAVCPDGLVPLVRFDHGSTMAIRPKSWVVQSGNRVVAERLQIPLALAWSVSVHKCQGMTLDSASTDLSKAFGFGMVYVALSRVRSSEGLYLSGFNPSKIKAHPKVVQFYNSLAREQASTKGFIGLEFRFSLSDYLSSRQKG